MMQFKRNIKILAVLVISAYSALVLAQSQPQQNGYGLGSTAGTGPVSATRTTTNSTGGVGTEETAPSDVTTMDPMDPARDSRAGSDSTMGNRRNRRAMDTTSATAVPETTTSPRY